MIFVALILSYLLGAIPFGVLAGRLRGVDIRAQGSGNSGATNVWRVLGPVAGVAVFTLDVLKGVAAPFIARQFLGNEAHLVIALCAATAVIGHTFSCFLKFRGGKGIATGLGMALGLAPLPALIALAVWGVALLISRMISAASIIAALALPSACIAIGTPKTYTIVMTIVALLAILKHIPNMRRIMTGTEPRVGKETSP